MQNNQKLSDLTIYINKEMGVPYSADNIRKLEKLGIVDCSYTVKGHRFFTDEQFKKSVRNIVFYFMGATIDEIKSNGEVLKARGKKIVRVAKSLLK